MKKILIATVLGAALVLALSTLAMADNGPHGGFAASTDACASCHRTHSAQYGSNALLISNPTTLCLSCHDGTGAGTNVVDGVYTQAGSNAHTGVAGSVVEGTDGASLLGGGFTNALMTTAWTGSNTASAVVPSSRATTSTHRTGVQGVVWGSGGTNSVNGAMVLQCVSCHDPHGNAGWDLSAAVDGDDVRVASYRLLRWQPSGSAGFAPPTAANVNWTGGAFPLSDMGTALGTDVRGWLVPDLYGTNGGEWYTIGTLNAFAPGDYTAAAAGLTSVRGGPSAVYNATRDYRVAATNLAFFCAQCHDRYLTNTRLRNHEDASAFCGHPQNGTTPSGPATGAFVILAHQPPVLNATTGFWEHPIDPVRCLPVGSATTAAGITAWGDNGESGDSTYRFMHSSGDIRVVTDGSTGTALDATTLAHINSTAVGRTCVACHVSHGTAAQMTPFAASSGPAGASLAGGSTLLRLDNRGVCMRCHFGDVNFTLAP